MKVGILSSGGLGLQTIKICLDIFKPSFIATDKKSEGLINYASEMEIPLFIGNPRDGKLSSFLNGQRFYIIFSINYLFLIESDIISLAEYPINFHGSLLPKYRGRTPHVWSIINNEETTGITAHLIDEDCDTGPIILQKEIAITFFDTGDTILAKYNNEYPDMVKEVFHLVKSGQFTLIEQNNKLATFFGKRTPNDGQINWAWQKERIRNWVRAQAFPYPGAFGIINNEKVIIDEITFSGYTYSFDMPNGLIVQDEPEILVKTSNGVIELNKIRTNKILCKKGKIFDYEN